MWKKTLANAANSGFGTDKRAKAIIDGTLESGYTNNRKQKTYSERSFKDGRNSYK